MDIVRQRRTTDAVSELVLFVLILVRSFPPVNPKVPGSRPGRPTTGAPSQRCDFAKSTAIDIRGPNSGPND